MEFDISDRAFGRIRKFIHEQAGIHLGEGKKPLVCTRLARRLRANDLQCFDDYVLLLARPDAAAERQLAIDLLTTNETYFFREPKHFEFIARVLAARSRQARPFRVWSAASSTGEEPYSVAMLLADKLSTDRPGTGNWEVFASDISARVLETARAGRYPLDRAGGIPTDYLKRYCLKGTGPELGMLMVDPALREQVRFEQVNLSRTLPRLGEFDLILLRNVMIYFDQDMKREVVARLVEHLVPGGHLLVGHSETLNGVDDKLRAVSPSIYQRPPLH
jgi:chemotaxis protein methyltransferase CheR